MKNSSLFFLDLDGPILDVRDRYHQVYSTLLQERGFACLSKEEYWDLKRSKTPEKTILEKTQAGSFFSEYQSLRKSIIESEINLQFDHFQENTIKSLKFLKEHGTLVLVTLRHNRETCLQQLKRSGIFDYFDHVLSGELDIKPRSRIKEALVQEALPHYADAHIKKFFIGDTETDIEAGKNLNCITYGVRNGIRNESLIKTFQPHFEVETLWDACRSILDFEINHA